MLRCIKCQVVFDLDESPDLGECLKCGGVLTENGETPGEGIVSDLKTALTGSPIKVEYAKVDKKKDS